MESRERHNFTNIFSNVLADIHRVWCSRYALPVRFDRSNHPFPRYFDGWRIRSSRSASVSSIFISRRRFRMLVAARRGRDQACLASSMIVRQTIFRRRMGDIIYFLRLPKERSGGDGAAKSIVPDSRCQSPADHSRERSSSGRKNAHPGEGEPSKSP